MCLISARVHGNGNDSSKAIGRISVEESLEQTRVGRLICRTSEYGEISSRDEPIQTRKFRRRPLENILRMVGEIDDADSITFGHQEPSHEKFGHHTCP